jgi:hypothetical protein
MTNEVGQRWARRYEEGQRSWIFLLACHPGILKIMMFSSILGILLIVVVLFLIVALTARAILGE